MPKPRTRGRTNAAADTAPKDEAVELEPVDPPDIDPTVWATLLDALGLDATATADDVLAAVQGLVDKEAATDGAPSAIAAAAGRAGLEVMDTDTATALRAAAAEGAQIKAAAAAQRREQVVNDAIKAGKITRARAGHWRTLIEHDPGMEQVLASIPRETAFPVTERGHSVDVDDDGDGSTWFR
ncbi:phage protease [Tsukamurella paurometabola]|uniref:Mu-like prophage I protein n=1 Tax=Tsukamurella paurometabola TaxID=2061 RepID=A0ABS5NI89_TSUPA|nr:phage protease [Tsukamurella paurometabola]MBS4104011.1 hypothetical protein [Tsukamurella paurometabola]